MDNLLSAWQEFIKGKRNRADAQEFGRELMANLFELHGRLVNGLYRHGAYEAFTVHDPKTRRIHKAGVADRVLHCAIYRKLYPFFDRTFIEDSYSCRIGKGTHKALNRYRDLARQVSKNHRKTAWVLKGDIRKFFASIDQDVLLAILSARIADKRIVWLLKTIVRSFSSGQAGKGLLLGNLTSQLFANVYLNEFDQFIKHHLRAKNYIRYADDFVILSPDRGRLERLIPAVRKRLSSKLRLELHPDKLELRAVASGIDFLGWVHFPHHRVIRSGVKARIVKTMSKGASPEKIASYLGHLKHGNTHNLFNQIRQTEQSARILTRISKLSRIPARISK